MGFYTPRPLHTLGHASLSSRLEGSSGTGTCARVALLHAHPGLELPWEGEGQEGAAQGGAAAPGGAGPPAAALGPFFPL